MDCPLEDLRELNAQLARLTKKAALRLHARFGVGPQTAATLLATAGDNPTRLHSEAAWAALCGTSPLQALSGKTQRHRLNRGGDRQDGTSGAHWQYIRGSKLRKLQSAIESVTHDNFDVSHLLVGDPAFTVFFDKHFAFVISPGEIERKQQRENHLKAKEQRLAREKNK